MFTLFQYNWQVRDDWFNWCAGVPEEQLFTSRAGGVGGILKTLFHVVDVEYSWISALQGKPDFEPFDSYCTLRDIRDLSERLHEEIEPYISGWTSEQELADLRVQRSNGEWMTYKHGEIMRHVIAHEIHHMGQLSVWAREMGREPITANLIRRGLYG